MWSLVLLRISPTTIAGFLFNAVAYSLNLSLVNKSFTIFSATRRESLSFHLPLRSIVWLGSIRDTDRAQEISDMTKTIKTLSFINNYFILELFLSLYLTI